MSNIEKQLDKLTEQFTIQGEHFSYLINDLTEIKTVQKDNIRILSENTETLKSHNERLRKMEEWKLRYDGAKSAINFMWGIASVFFIASVFGMFKMYIFFVNFQDNMDLKIQNAVTKNLDDY